MRGWRRCRWRESGRDCGLPTWQTAGDGVKLTIDNLDGLGAVDYSGALAADAPLTIERVLNAAFALRAGCWRWARLAVPVRRARVVVTAANGTLLFTGYLATEPVPVYAGVGSAGPVYRVCVQRDQR